MFETCTACGGFQRHILRKDRAGVCILASQFLQYYLFYLHICLYSHMQKSWIVQG